MCHASIPTRQYVGMTYHVPTYVLSIYTYNIYIYTYYIYIYIDAQTRQRHYKREPASLLRNLLWSLPVSQGNSMTRQQHSSMTCQHVNVPPTCQRDTTQANQRVNRMRLFQNTFNCSGRHIQKISCHPHDASNGCAITFNSSLYTLQWSRAFSYCTNCPLNTFKRSGKTCSSTPTRSPYCTKCSRALSI